MKNVQHRTGCPFCGTGTGTPRKEAWGAWKVFCDGCRAFGPRDFEKSIAVSGWKSDLGKVSPLWCEMCDEMIGEATFSDGVAITVRLRPKVHCLHEVSCIHYRKRWTKATSAQIAETQVEEERLVRRRHPSMGTIRGKHAYFTNLEFRSTFRVDLPVPKKTDAWWFEEGAGGGGIGNTRSYEERNATQKEIDGFLAEEKKMRDEERREDEKWASVLRPAGLRLGDFSRVRSVTRRNGTVHILTRDYGRSLARAKKNYLKDYPDEDPTYWHYEFRILKRELATAER